MEDVRIHTSADTRVFAPKGCSGLDNPDEPLRCVFSTVTEVKVGTGTTAKKQRSKLLWYVKQRDVDAFGIRKINPSFVPVGEEIIITHDQLLEEYTPEVAIHNSQVEPAMCALRKAIAKGDKARESDKPLSAEMEYTKALDVDETNVRAIFGLGLVYLERGDKVKSRAVFEQLVTLEAAFSPNHKHLFNEFGIQLRKNALFEEAVQYYTRAVELTSEDENLFYNIARAFYEKDDWELCFEFTSRALTLNPYHEHAMNLCKVIVALGQSSALRDKYKKPPVPESVLKSAIEVLGESKDDMGQMVELESHGFGDGKLEASSFSLDDLTKG